MKYTLNVEGSGDDLYITFPDEVLKEVGWKEGDSIKWEQQDDGSFILSKVKKTVTVLVDCISTYRMRYAVEVPADNPEWALDTVTCEEAKEFSQKWLGETIVSHRIVDREEILKICDEDNDYCSSWTDDKKLEVFTTPWVEAEYEAKFRSSSTAFDDQFVVHPDDIEHSEYYYDTERNKPIQSNFLKEYDAAAENGK